MTIKTKQKAETPKIEVPTKEQILAAIGEHQAMIFRLQGALSLLEQQEAAAKES
jgi:hypothetical protein